MKKDYYSIKIKGGMDRFESNISEPIYKEMIEVLNSEEYKNARIINTKSDTFIHSTSWVASHTSRKI